MQTFFIYASFKDWKDSYLLEELITINEKELVRIKIAVRMQRKEIKQKTAAEEIGICELSLGEARDS